ncbi:MAG: RNA methyltransferase [Bacilli bacterium]|jgi:TrmH family RNA methyltransferase|nr:RNA methyltransferase [Bacilli bacterium]
MEVIKSLQNNQVKELVKLKQRKYREAKQEFIIEGAHLLKEAYLHHKIKLLVTSDLKYNNDNLKILYVSEEVMKKISNLQTSSKYLGVCDYFNKEIDFSLNMVVLDDIQDPGNLGNIMRTSLAFNVTNIIVSKGNVDFYSPKVVQASQGAIFQLNLLRIDLLPFIELLRVHDYLLIGTSLTKALNLDTYQNSSDKKALFIGNEGQGLKEEILAVMDYNYYISINNIQSLNVGNALAIFLYEFSKKNC